WKPVHFLNNVSVSIASVMQPAGLENSDGIISSYYGKDPDDPEWAKDPAMVKWAAFMQKYYPDGSLHSTNNVYGYGVAITLEHVLKACGDELTRENIMKQAASMKDVAIPTLLPGIKLNTSPSDFAPIQQMQLMKFDGKAGKWVRFGAILGGS
ncbi:MAG TPA: ABC transporter substrate-binding protein, partial [bacterium]